MYTYMCVCVHVGVYYALGVGKLCNVVIIVESTRLCSGFNCKKIHVYARHTAFANYVLVTISTREIISMFRNVLDCH